jgi:hypothetical protein
MTVIRVPHFAPAGPRDRPSVASLFVAQGHHRSRHRYCHHRQRPTPLPVTGNPGAVGSRTGRCASTCGGIVAARTFPPRSCPLALSAGGERLLAFACTGTSPNGIGLANKLRVAAALAEARYGFRLVLGDGGHNPNHGGVLLPKQRTSP